MKRTSLVALVFSAVLVLVAPAAAAARDGDRDGLPDRWERKHRLSTKAKSAGADADRDRVDNGNEWREGTSPRDADSDNDGRRDGAEDADRDLLSNADEDTTGNDPKDRDSDDDGVIDGKERAGVISSYKGGVLRINLGRGKKVSGRVTDETEVYCQSVGNAESKWLKKGVRKPVEDGAEDDEFFEDEEDEVDEEELTDPDYLAELDEELGLAQAEQEFEEEDEEELEEEVELDADDDSTACPHTRLKTGAKVHEAELELTSTGAVFVEIELVR